MGNSFHVGETPGFLVDVGGGYLGAGSFIESPLVRRHRFVAKQDSGRAGTVLVLTSIGLVSIVGMMFVVLESGRVVAKLRHVQNSADSAALAAALTLVRGQSSSSARSSANSYVSQYNSLAGANVTVSIPPASGPYAGRTGFVETRVVFPVETPLMQAIGGPAFASIHARAVAGLRSDSCRGMVIALDKRVTPGFNCVGNGQFSIEGECITNSQGWGVTENYQSVSGALNGYAASVSGNGCMRADSIRVCGGVNNPAGFQPYTPGGGTPLRCQSDLYPDPFINLPTPTVSTGVINVDRGSISMTSSNSTRTFAPGIYTNIRITSGTSTFQPGIYVIRGGELRITGGTCRASGCMFYITTEDYDPNSGLPDCQDGEGAPLTSSTHRGGVTITSNALLNGLDNSNSPFDGMLVYCRRKNDSAINVAGNASAGNCTGTVYSKWSQLTLSGQGTFNTQFVVGCVKWSGNGNMTLRAGGYKLGKSNLVHLVE